MGRVCPILAGQNTILGVQNAIPHADDSAVGGPSAGDGADEARAAENAQEGGVAERIAQRSLAAREATYADEVQRLLDAGLAVIHSCGTERSPRVADIVAAAGLSNDAFYRHFAGKAELVAAILEAGAERLAGYLAHQMAKAATPEGRLRAWIAGVMAQASNPQVADQTRAVLWNGSSLGDRGRDRTVPHRSLLADAVGDLSVAQPERATAVVFLATMNLMEEFLWRREAPTVDDVEHLVAFCLAGVAG